MEKIDETLLRNANRSVARKVADHLPAIEEAMSLGISQTEIIEYLSKQGITVTYLNFRSILQRLRKKKSKGEIPKQMKSIATQSQVGNSVTIQNSPAVKPAGNISDASTKSNPTENKVGSDLVTETKEAKIPFTWRELRKEVIDF